MIDRARYEARLAARSIPASIIATRPSTPVSVRQKGGWSRGKDRKLTHNCWLVVTVDPTQVRKNVRHVISFDTAVDFPGVLLSSDTLINDRLTKKILILTCLTTGPVGNGALDAMSVRNVSHRFDWLLRFRLAEGYESFGSIPTFFASDFSKRLKKGGTLALVPIEERLDATLELYAGMASLVIDRAFATHLGISLATLARSTDFRRALADADPSAIVDESIAADDPDLENTQTVEDSAVEMTPSRSTVTRSLHRYLEILEYLYRLSERDLDHDRLERDPFETISRKAIIVRDGEESGRTDTLLPPDMMRVLTVAAKFLTSYAEYIVAGFRLSRSSEGAEIGPIETGNLHARMPKGGFCVLPLWSRGYYNREPLPPRTILLGEAIRHLFASCAILFGGFGARRDIGVRSAHHGCLTESEGGLLMKFYIGKTDKERVDIPVPAIVKTAVKVLDDLSADTRAANGTEWLFEVAPNLENPKRFISSQFFQIIDELLEFMGEPPPEGRDRWNVGIHMLRRGHGIWYYFGLTGGSTDALSLLYRHNDPQMTRIYFTMVLPGEINKLETELKARLLSSALNRTEEDKKWIDQAYEQLAYKKAYQKDFDGSGCEVFVEKMIGLWRGTDSVVGIGGKALFNDVMAIAERAMGSVRIGSRANDPSAHEAPLLKRLMAYAQSHFLEPVIGTNMWCTANPHDKDDRADAECLKLKSRGKAPWKKETVEPLMPDHDFACNRICIGCRFGVAFQKGQSALDREVAERRKAVEFAATASHRDEGALLLAELEADIAAAGPAQRGGFL